jgi:hypothetical protein
MPNGWFYVLPEIDVKKLESLFRHKVLKLLLREKKISREWVEKLLSWRNSGFNIHNQVKIRSQDKSGRECLAQYILRSPFSQEKMTYRKDRIEIRQLRQVRHRNSNLTHYVGV